MTGVAAQLAHVAGDGVDLNAPMQAAWEFVGRLAKGKAGVPRGVPTETTPTRRRNRREFRCRRASAAAAAVAGPDGTTPAEDLAAGPPPQSPRTPHRTSALKGETFGGKDLSKFPSIPESPKATPSPNKSPSRKKSLGRNLVEGVASHLGPAMRLGRGVGNSASHLIPRPLFSGRDGVRVAIARDAAFCHYYRENLALLEASGADLVPFSPNPADVLPPGGKASCSAEGTRSCTPPVDAEPSPRRHHRLRRRRRFLAVGGWCFSRSLSDDNRPMCGLAPFATGWC